MIRVVLEQRIALEMHIDTGERYAMAFKKVRLELARDKDFPFGSSEHGYEFVAPIGDDGLLDPKQWKENRERCKVRRFWGGEEEEIGHLIRRPGGSWAFHYDIHGDSGDDESGYRFGNHTFVNGDYVSIMEHDDKLRTFRIVAVEDLEPNR